MSGRGLVLCLLTDDDLLRRSDRVSCFIHSWGFSPRLPFALVSLVYFLVSLTCCYLMCAVLSPQVRNSLVIHAVADAPTGPYQMTDIALPSVHTNPQIMRTPDGDWLLYSQAVCASNQYDPVKGCVGCHKGMCGLQVCVKPSPFPPLLPGLISFSRRERPKMLFDKEGTPTHLFNSADPGGACSPPNPGWERNSRPFTMVTEILSEN